MSPMANVFCITTILFHKYFIVFIKYFLIKLKLLVLSVLHLFSHLPTTVSVTVPLIADDFEITSHFL